MREKEQRRFTREFKLRALERMAAGENVSELARELGVLRKCLYQWQDRYRLGGSVALRSRGRPTKAEALAIRAAQGDAPASARQELRDPLSRPVLDELTLAQRRIAELERKIGQQQADLDFFQQALRQVREARQRSGVPGGTAPTRSSKR